MNLKSLNSLELSEVLKELDINTLNEALLYLVLTTEYKKGIESIKNNYDILEISHILNEDMIEIAKFLDYQE